MWTGRRRPVFFFATPGKKAQHRGVFDAGFVELSIRMGTLGAIFFNESFQASLKGVET
jgi:hypothetical protein